MYRRMCKVAPSDGERRRTGERTRGRVGRPSHRSPKAGRDIAVARASKRVARVCMCVVRHTVLASAPLPFATLHCPLLSGRSMPYAALYRTYTPHCTVRYCLRRLERTGSEPLRRLAVELVLGRGSGVFAAGGLVVSSVSD
eukprot:3781208-Pyramimonas_sp.AAC.1